MNVQIKDISETKKEVKITIPSKKMEEYTRDVVDQIKKEQKFDGFRQGNVPESVIKSKVGEGEILQKATEKAVHESYPKAVKENNLFALSTPQVEITKCAPGNDLEYKATVYILPEITLPDYKKISTKTLKKESKDVQVEDKEVEQALEGVQNMRAKNIAVTRGAEKGDLVTISFSGTMQEEQEKKINEENFQVLLGSEDMGVFKELEENIYGMKANEEKEFTLEIPDVNNKDKKQKMDINLKMVTVMERELPKINDEFAKQFQLGGLKELKERIKEDIKKEKENKEKEKIKNTILKEISKETKFEIPEILVEKELDNMIKTAENQLKEKNASFDDYLKEIGKTLEELKSSWRKQAEENVSFALILHKIGENEKIEIKDEEVEKEVERHFQLMGKKKEDESKENIQRIKNYVYDLLKNKKIFSILSVD